MSDIYLLDLAADFKPRDDPRRLTSQKGLNHSPAWTPDGRRIIFTSGGRESSRLWRVSASGSGNSDELPLHDAWSFALSRIGHRLVYVRAGEGEHIWRLSLSDSGEASGPPRKFISSTRTDYAPQYSPDGKRIVFESDRDGNHGIWVCDADGSNVVDLSSQAGMSCRHASLVPGWRALGLRLQCFRQHGYLGDPVQRRQTGTADI